MGLRLWLLVVATAAVAHAILLAVDRQIEAGVDRLSDYHSVTSAVPDLKSVTARSAYMRNER